MLNNSTQAFLSGLPYLVRWVVAILGSTGADLVIERRLLSKTNVRKLANTLATLVPALALLGVSRSML